MSQRFTGSVVVITGASSGVGRATARAFGAEGAKVALIARGAEGLAAAAEEIRAVGGEARVFAIDVADSTAVYDVADQIVSAWGRIDFWINDAMQSVFAPAWDVTPEEFKRVTEVTYFSYVYGTLAALRHMRSRNEGVIIQIGSALAYRSLPLQSTYCAAKSAIRGFTDSLRSELIHERSAIKVTMVQLPAVNTPQFGVVRNKLEKHGHPVRPIYEPEVIARAVLAAAARPTREVWLGLPTIKAILGQRVIPGLLDRYLARKAWTAQMTDKIPPTHADNLWSPLPGDRGARGAFSDEARSSSIVMWARRHRAPLTLAAIATVAAAAARAGTPRWMSAAR